MKTDVEIGLKAVMSKAMLGATRSWKKPESSGRSQPFQQLDFGLMASRTMRDPF